MEIEIIIQNNYAILERIWKGNKGQAPKVSGVVSVVCSMLSFGMPMGGNLIFRDFSTRNPTSTTSIGPRRFLQTVQRQSSQASCQSEPGVSLLCTVYTLLPIERDAPKEVERFTRFTRNVVAHIPLPFVSHALRKDSSCCHDETGALTDLVEGNKLEYAIS